MRHILPIAFLLYFFLPALTLQGQNEDKSVEKLAKMEFEQIEYNYGKAPQGDTARTTFVFTNTGEADLVIERAKGSCICTVPFYEESPVPPGEKGEIQVEFRTDEQELGEQDRTVTIIYNGNPKVIRLRMRGEVIEKRTLEVNPGGNQLKLGGDEDKEEENGTQNSGFGIDWH